MTNESGSLFRIIKNFPNNFTVSLKSHSTFGMQYKLTIFQRIIPHYRVPFFEQLSERLEKSGVAVTVVYGQHRQGTVPEGMKLDAKWANFQRNRYLNIFSKELVLQTENKAFLRGADMVVVEQASRLLLNYLLFLGRLKNNYQIAYWGHSKNYQTTRWSIFDFLKARTLTIVDWWFVYTQSGMDELLRSNFPREKITLVENSLENESVTRKIPKANLQTTAEIKERLNIQTDNVGLLCGGFDEKKNIPLVIEACKIIREKLPDFHMIFIGHGPDIELITSFDKQESWVSYVGPIIGANKDPFFNLSKALIMPGSLGLVVIDSFTYGTPIITTDISTHSPEFDYLRHGTNGVVSAPDIASYCSAVVGLFNDEQYRLNLVDGCRESRDRYTLSNMVENFARGVEKCLKIR